MTRKTVRTFHGIILVLLLSCGLLFVFYGNVILSLNTSYFSLSGDGILSYFNSVYLARYDTALMFSHSINYPYGELSFYTQSQPLVIGFVKFISNHITDITPYIIGIINFLMLISIILAAVFLYMICTEVKLPTLPALLVSIGIAFLSPQIDRMGGHFTLSYVWAIPFLIYMLFLFHKKNNTVFSILIGMALFILMTGHIYFAAFYFSFITIYWLWITLNIKKKSFREYLPVLFQFTLQFIAPVFVFYLITANFNDLVPDRPSKPYGFLVYKASPESVFLPLGMEYGRFLHKLRNFSYVQWEGISYVGLTAALGFVVLFAGALVRLFQRKWRATYEITDNAYLNIIFWASFITLLYSFGIPFIFGLDFLLDYLGPLQQMRALGRFAWPFFYMINLVVFYKLWQWQKLVPRRSVVFWLAIIMLFVDVFYFSKGKQKALNNPYPEWTDITNTTSANQWFGHLNVDEYQSIIPVPFYHMGSDNYSINTRCNMLAQSFLVSVKTGLPVMAIYTSRASIPQSVKNMAIGLEPYREPEILKDLQSKKPFLIVAARCNENTPAENNLLNHAERIDSSDQFILYRIEYDKLMSLHIEKSQEIIDELKSKQFINSPATFLTHPAARMIHVGFDDSVAGGYQGHATLIKGRSDEVIYEGPVSNEESGLNVSLSCWLYPADKDLFPKARFIIEMFDHQGNRYDIKNFMFGHHLKVFDGSWALFEFPITLIHEDDRIKVTVCNTEISQKQNYRIDELLVRPDFCNVYTLDRKTIMKNNRWYHFSD